SLGLPGGGPSPLGSRSVVAVWSWSRSARGASLVAEAAVVARGLARVARGAESTAVAWVVGVEASAYELGACERPVVGVNAGLFAALDADRVACEDCGAEAGAVCPPVATACGAGPGGVGALLCLSPLGLTV